METRERPKARVPKRETQVGEEDRSLEDAPRLEAELKELRKSMGRLELKKSTEGESFRKIIGFQEKTGSS